MRNQFLVVVGLIGALGLAPATVARADSFTVSLGYYDTTHTPAPFSLTFDDKNALTSITVDGVTTNNPGTGVKAGVYDGGVFVFKNPTASSVTVSGLTVEMKSLNHDVVWTFNTQIVAPNSSLTITQGTLNTGLNPLSGFTNTSQGEFFDGSELGPTGQYSKNTGDLFTATVSFSVNGGPVQTTDGTPLFGKPPDGGNESLNPVPEPGSVILLGIGAIALAGYAVRRRRQTIG
jgi:hypothetical protein